MPNSSKFCLDIYGKLINPEEFIEQNPITYEPMNLSICENMKATITIQVELSDEFIEMVQNIIPNFFQKNPQCYNLMLDFFSY